MKHTLRLTYLLISVLLLGACHKENTPNNRNENPVSRTVIVYMVADNNLYSNVSINYKQMLAGAKKGLNGGNLLVYVDEMNKTPVVYKVTESGAKVVKNYPEQDSASPEVFGSVVEELFDLYPADSKGMMMWSHGEGWLYRVSNSYAPKSLSIFAPEMEAEQRPMFTKWFGQDLQSSDGTSPNYLNIKPMRQALEQHGIHLDFMVFDACFMACVEVAYELRNVVSHVIASPCEILASNYPYYDYTGFPYQNTVPQLFKEPISYPAIAQTFYDYYNGFNMNGSSYESKMKSAAISVIKTSELDSLAKIVRGALAEVKFTSAYPSATSVQFFDKIGYGRNFHLYYDLKDAIGRNVSAGEKTTLFQKQLLNTIPYSNFTPYIISEDYLTINRFCGMTTMLPQASNQGYHYSYDQLDWYKDAGYDQFPGWVFY